MQQSGCNNDPINISNSIKCSARTQNNYVGKILQDQNMTLINFNMKKDLISINKIIIEYTIKFAQIK